jgi:hypothetical protein
VQVEKCKHCVVVGETWDTLAAVYATDWLQLWSTNAGAPVQPVWGSSGMDGVHHFTFPLSALHTTTHIIAQYVLSWYAALAMRFERVGFAGLICCCFGCEFRVLTQIIKGLAVSSSRIV